LRPTAGSNRHISRGRDPAGRFCRRRGYGRRHAHRHGRQRVQLRGTDQQLPADGLYEGSGVAVCLIAEVLGTGFCFGARTRVSSSGRSKHNAVCFPSHTRIMRTVPKTSPSGYKMVTGSVSWYGRTMTVVMKIDQRGRTHACPHRAHLHNNHRLPKYQ
jgi:hypothetical protein